MNLIDLGDPDSMAAAKAKAAGSSFYWAMRTLPKGKRQSMYAIYAFCREVDDLADGDAPPAAKQRSLERWRSHVDRLFRPESVPVFQLEAPLRRAIELHGLRRKDFHAIIDGMLMDALGPMRAPALAELDLYCDRVASAVGRLSVRVFGVSETEGEILANRLGRALQLTNILRDLGEDAALGRLYLPREVLAGRGLDPDDPDLLKAPSLPTACRDLAAVARGHYVEALAVAKHCDPAQIRPALIMAAVYRATLDRLEAGGWRHPERRVDIGAPRKLWILLRHGLM